jgi:antitoxin HicB
MKYPALFEPTDGGKILITFPDVEEAVSQGDDEQDAIDMAQDALVTWFAHCIRHSKAIHPPSRPKGRKYRMIGLPAMVSAKVALYTAFQNSSLTKAELGRRLAIPKTNVDRLFDFKNHTRLDQLEAAFRVLGKDMSITVSEAA